MKYDFFSQFDKTFFITLSSSKERIENVKNIINKYNINNSVIYYITKLPDIYLKCSSLFPSLKIKYYDDNTINNYYTYSNVFSCAINHLNIVKITYELGLNNILICEDDVNFIDYNLLNKISKLIPNDYDIIKFANDGNPEKMKKIDENSINEDNNIFSKIILNDLNLSTMCYALSRSGMKKYIDYILKINDLYISDCIFNELLKYYNNNINIYRSNYYICPKKDFISTII